jgi:hypothetical protein
VDLSTLRLLEHLHGHLGWLTVAALAHPAILLRPERRAPWSVGLACLFVSLTSALGYLLYPDYRARIRQHLFQDAPRVAWLFERKEHLAYGALALAWAGAAAYLAARRAPDVEASLLFQRAARLAFAASATLAGIVAAFGIAVAVTRTF